MLPAGGATTGGTDGTRDDEHGRRHGAAGTARAVRGAPRRPRRRLAGLRGMRMARRRACGRGAHGRDRDGAAAAIHAATGAEGVLEAGAAHADLRERLVFVAFVVFFAPAFLVFLAAALAGRAAAVPSPLLPARARLASSAAMRSTTLAGSSTNGSATISSPAAFFSR